MIDTLLRSEKGAPLTHEEMDTNFQVLEDAANDRPTLDGEGAHGDWDIDIKGNADNVKGIVATDHGGTGANTPQQALANLGAYPATNPKNYIDSAGAPVQSVAGKKGAVTLVAADIGGLTPSATTDTTNASNINSGTLPAGRLPALSGDISTNVGSGITTLANTGVGAGNYGSSTQVATFTVDAKGRLFAAGNLTVTPHWSNVTNKPTTQAGYGITDVINIDKLGVANGVAQLGPDGRLKTEQIPTALVGALQYQGTWNATTNTPPVAGMNATKGQYYKVSVAGTTLVDGQAYWQVGDLLIHNGVSWDRVEGGGTEVTTVAGRVGAIVLTAADIGGLSTSATVDTTNASNLSSGTVPVARLPALAGDATSNLGGNTLTLAASGVVAGNYGGATAIPTFTVDAKGRLTLAASVAPVVAWNNVTGKPTTIAGYGITDALQLSANAALALAVNASAGTANTAARSDHVHAMPNLDVLANVTIAAKAVGDFLTWSGDKWINSPHNTMTVEFARRLASTRLITLGGDANGSVGFDGSQNVQLDVTLDDTGVVVGTYGSATQSPSFTVDSKGRIVSASMATITPAWGDVTGKPTTIAGYGITDALKLGTTVTALGTSTAGTSSTAAKSDHVHAMPTVDQLANVVTAGKVAGDVLSWNGTAWITAAQSSVNSGSATKLQTARTIQVSGDVDGQASFDGSANVNIAVTLDNTGVAAGSYGTSGVVPVITVDSKGRITGVVNANITIPFSSVGSLPTTLAGYGILDAINTNKLGVANGVATLGADGKLLASQIPASLVGALVYQGSWNAATNVPAVSGMAPSKGHYYKVSTPGTTNVDGQAYWQAGDMMVYNGATWDRIEGGSTEVTSVAGRVGDVVLTKADVGLSAVENKSSANIRAELTPNNIHTGLGYQPVQQGTGVGQGANLVKIGWAPDSTGLKVTVDVTDLGYIYTSGGNGHRVPFNELVGVPTTLAGYGITNALSSASLGVANGVASLDANARLVMSQLPPLARSASIQTFSIAPGWYTIATNTGNRAQGKFHIIDATSGLHQSLVLLAGHHFGTGNELSLLQNSSHAGGGPVQQVRIKSGGTYDGAMLQIYIDVAASDLSIYLGDNLSNNGWVLKNFVPDGTDPGGVNTIAAVTNVSALMVLDTAPFQVAGDIYFGGKTTQYLGLHTNNFGVYALPRTGGDVNGAITLTGGFDLRLRAGAAGDTGDIIYQNLDGTERHRIYDGTTNLLYRLNNGTPYAMLHAGNVGDYAPSLAGAGATGVWNIGVNGPSGSITVYDVEARDANQILPNEYPQKLRTDFVSAGSVGTGGNYAGLMTFSPWTGKTPDGGDGSYQLAFGSTGANGTGVPQLRIRKGIDTTWNQWYDILTTASLGSSVVNRNGDTMAGALNYKRSNDMVAAATMDLNTATGNYVSITGNTLINTLVLAAGAMRIVHFQGTPVLQHHATYCSLPGGQNIQTAPGDIAIFIGDSGGVVRCVSFLRANGLDTVMQQEAVFGVNATTTTTGFNLSSGFMHTFLRMYLQSNTTVMFSGVPTASDRAYTWSLLVLNDGVAGRALNFGNTIKWAGGQPPNRTTAANGVDLYTFVVDNGIIYGSLSILDAR